MVESKPCVVCGESTIRVLFGDALVGIYVCSRMCELEYFESLRHRKEERQILLRYLDERIARTKRYSQVGWAGTAVGVVWLTLGALLVNLSVIKDVGVGLLLFTPGVFVMTCGAFSTSYFDDRKRKLTETRRKLA